MPWNWYDSQGNLKQSSDLEPHGLDEHVDVDTTGVADGDALVYVSADSAWKPGESGGIGPHGLDEHTDVSTASLEDGDFLRYDAGTFEWINEHASDVSNLVHGRMIGDGAGGFQTVAGSATAIDSFNTVEEDYPTGVCDTVNNRFVIPEDGIYIASFWLRYANTPSGSGRAYFDLEVNGSVVQRAWWNKQGSGADDYTETFMAREMQAGDFVTFAAAQQGDTTQNVRPRASISKVGEIIVVGKTSPIAIGSFDSPSSTGNYSVTGLGFTPKLVEFELLHPDGTNNASTARGSMTTTGQHCWAINAHDTANARQFDTSSCMRRISQGGVLQIRAVFVSMDDDGFTVNFTTTTSNGIILWKAIG